MKTLRWMLVATSLLALVLVSCEARRSTEYQGGLYFGQGSYLMRYSLRDGSLSVVGHLGDTVIREISPLRSDHLLIAETAWANERRVPRISWFSLETSESVDLYAGLHARYLATGNVIVYDDGESLYAVPQRPDSDNIVIFTHEKNELNHLLEATPGLLLFETREAGTPVVRSWNTSSGELRELDALTDACRLNGAIWITPLQRLACKRRGGAFAQAEYVLAALDGTVDRPLRLPVDKQFRALSFIEEQDALVLSETWRGLLGKQDQHSVWVLDIQAGESHRLPGDVNLGISAVYADY